MFVNYSCYYLDKFHIYLLPTQEVEMWQEMRARGSRLVNS